MKTKPILVVLLILGIALVFRSFFSNLPLVWGDAPYFYPDTFKFLVNENLVWTTRGIALGGINQLMWLYPVMFVYGMLHTALGLNNDLIIRILFYFPSVILAVATPTIFIKKLKLDFKIGLITRILYVFNTYYLLVVDGGQVGIALAYGLFPILLVQLIELANRPNKSNFWISLTTSFLMCLVDPRFFIVAIVTLLFWIGVQFLADKKLPHKKILVNLFLLGLALLGLNSYWLVPMLSAGADAIAAQSSGLQLVSLLNTLLLFQPHWPTNIFGHVIYPSFYFAITPVFLFLGLYLKKNKKIFLIFVLFLVTAFIAKGDTPPLGAVYAFVVNKLPFGVVLRDSTKFWPPLILLAGVLIGYTFVMLEKKFNRLALLIPVAMLFFVYQALSGRLNFVLSNRAPDKNVLAVNEFLSDSGGQFRVAWMPEKYPIVYDSWDKQSIDAKDLVNLRPLANLNGGDYDRFNYMHDESFAEWYRLFGIKYAVLAGDPRVFQLNEQQQKDWDNLNNLTSTSSALIRDDQFEIPVYEISDAKPRVVASDQAVVSLGGQDKMSANIAMIFPEDGLFDPKDLQGIASSSASLYMDNKDKTDLQMSFLQDNFISPQENSVSDWSVWNASDYLKWKYQLLIRNVDTKEYDYNLGIAFSEKEDEEISFDKKVKRGNYILTIRTLSRNDSDALSVQINDQQYEVKNNRRNFEWFSTPVNILGDVKIKITNNSGFWVLNTVALIPEKDFKDADALADVYMNHFPILADKEFDELAHKSNWSDVSFSMINPTKYEVESDKPWIMLSDNYNENWKIVKGRSAVPFYSTVNGFYKSPNTQNVEIYFNLQEKSRWGLCLSALSAITIAIIFIYNFGKDEK